MKKKSKGAVASRWKPCARIYVRSLCPWAATPTLVCFFSGLAVLGAAASGRKLRLREFTFALCAVGRLRQRLRWLFLGSLCQGRLEAVGNWDCANLRSLAVPLGGCANACVSFFLARCSMGGCKRWETEIARIYVRSLCHWAVAPTLAWFFSGIAVLGAVASCWNWVCANLGSNLLCCDIGKREKQRENRSLYFFVVWTVLRSGFFENFGTLRRRRWSSNGCSGKVSFEGGPYACPALTRPSRRVGTYGEYGDGTSCAWMLGQCYREERHKAKMW